MGKDSHKKIYASSFHFKFIDNIHTETSGAEISAEIYSKYITLNFGNIFREK